MKLNARARKKIPLSEFGIPKKRAYPMPDREHAALAKEYAKGNLPLSQLGKIRAKANGVLGKQ